MANNNINKIICDVIDKAFEQKDLSSNKDITYLCSVSKVYADKSYQLTYNNVSYDVVTTNISLSVNDKVHLVIPQGNFKDKFVIEDVASGGGGGGSTITVDSELSTTSTNPVQNKVITTKINQMDSAIDENSSDIETLESDISSINSSINEINTNLSNKMNKNNPRGTGSFAMNGTASGDYATALNYDCTASGDCSVAEGTETIADGDSAHAEGWGSEANGSYSHAEGQSFAFGAYSHAENRSSANGDYSHSSGLHTTADYDYQFVTGKYNLPLSTDLFEVGNGTDGSHLSNAMRVTSDGEVHDGKGHKMSDLDNKAENTFSNIVIGNSTIQADSKTDTLTLEGSNVTLTPNTNTDKITIGITAQNIEDALGYAPLENAIVSGSQTSTSSEDGGNNVFTFVDAEGNTSTFTVKNGNKGSNGTNGTNGTDGVRGSLWNSGTAMSGTSTTTNYSYSGASNALVGDYYLNTTYGYVYRCVTAGSGTTAKWRYQGSIKGTDGTTPTINAASGANIGTVGTPTVTASTSGTTTTFTFNYLKGAKGDKGDKGDNATTTDTGTSSTAGLTKLYTSTGNNTDGSMTQKAITNELDGKAPTNHGNHVPTTETANNARVLRCDNTWYTLTPADIGAAPSGGGSVDGEGIYPWCSSYIAPSSSQSGNPCILGYTGVLYSSNGIYSATFSFPSNAPQYFYVPYTGYIVVDIIVSLKASDTQQDFYIDLFRKTTSGSVSASSKIAATGFISNDTTRINITTRPISVAGGNNYSLNFVPYNTGKTLQVVSSAPQIITLRYIKVTSTT